MLEDSLANHILVSSTDETETDPFNSLNFGEIIIKAKIPGKLLKPGRYFLTFFLSNKYGLIYDTAEKAIVFEINDYSTYRGMKNLYRSSAIVAPEIQFLIA